MLDPVADLNELTAAIAAVVGRTYRLTPLKVKCTYPVFKGESDGTEPVFVKVGTKEEWTRTRDLLQAVGDCGFFSRFVTEEPIDYRGHAVFVMEWRETRVVFPEDMNPRQLESFVAGCVKLGPALGKTAPAPQGEGASGTMAGVGSTPERLYGDILHYVARHPVAGMLLKGLVAIPAAERVYGARPLAVCHGDFHAKNFGFVGDEFAAVCDFDKLAEGLGCGDLVNALMERFSCFHLSRAARRRLRDVTRRIVAAVPWPREELVIACNVVRLQFAARRIRKHPNSAWVALDVRRRDRALCGFLACLEGSGS